MRDVQHPLDRPSLLGAIVILFHLVAETCRTSFTHHKSDESHNPAH